MGSIRDFKVLGTILVIYVTYPPPRAKGLQEPEVMDDCHELFSGHSRVPLAHMSSWRLGLKCTRLSQTKSQYEVNDGQEVPPPAEKLWQLMAVGTGRASFIRVVAPERPPMLQ